MSGLFITATGTEIGKTVLTAALACQSRADGGDGWRAVKPIISGYDPADRGSDTAVLLRAMGREATPGAAAEISPWRFVAPLSPDMAAAREGRAIDPPALVDWCRARMAEGPTLIEGVGGAFVPLAPGWLVADWIAALDIPFLLVTGSYLGSLSHTLSCIEALAARRLTPAAVIVSESVESPAPPEESIATLRGWLDMPIRLLPRQAGADPWRQAPSLADLLGKD